MKPLQRKLPPQKPRESVSEFVYDDHNEKNIGKRTGLYFGSVDPQKNYDGYARYSDYVTYGDADNYQTITEDNINHTNQELQLPQITSHAEIKQKRQQNEDKRKSTIITTRQKPIASPQFGAISSIKAKPIFTDRRSSFQQYRELLEQLGKNNEQFMKKTQQQQQKRLQQQQKIQKKKKLFSKASPIKQKQQTQKYNQPQPQINQVAQRQMRAKRKSVRFSDKQQIKNMLTDSINEQFVFLDNSTNDPIHIPEQQHQQLQPLMQQLQPEVQQLQIEEPQLKAKRSKTRQQFLQNIEQQQQQIKHKKQKMEMESIEKLQHLNIDSSNIENDRYNKKSKPKNKQKKQKQKNKQKIQKQKRSKSKRSLEKKVQNSSDSESNYNLNQKPIKPRKKVQKLLKQPQSPIQKPSKKIITSISQQFQIVSCTKDESIDQNQRYPKRHRSKPLQYWKSEKLAYQTGKIIGIVKKKSIFDYLGVEQEYQSKNYEQNNNQISQVFIVPPFTKIQFSGFTDQFVLLKLKKKSNFNQASNVPLLLEQYGQKIQIKKGVQCEILPYEKFALINKSSKNYIVAGILVKNQKTIDAL